MDIENPSEQITETSNKYTDWKREPKLVDLKQDYTDAKIAHDIQVSRINKWLGILHLTGSYKTKKREGYSSVQPKLIRKQAEWRHSALAEPFLSVVDLFTTSPVTFEDKEKAVQNGLVLNNQFNTKINKVRFINSLVRNCVNEGTAIIKSGWEFEEKIVTKTVPIYEEIPVTDLAQISAMQVEGTSPIEKIQIGEEEVEESITLKNNPCVEVCDYTSVIPDPTCKGIIERANFCIHDFETNLLDLKAEGNKYINLDKVTVTDTEVPSDADALREQSSFVFKDKSRKKITAHEYWGFHDIDDDGAQELFVCTWIGDICIRMQRGILPHKKLPFDFIPYTPEKNSLYGTPDGDLLEDSQNIVGAVTRGMLDLLGRSANGQIAHTAGSLDFINKRKFIKGLDYEVNSAENIQNTMYMHKYPEIPNSALAMLNMQNNEADSLSGIKGFSEGINGNTLGDSVGGIKSALSATAKREFDILIRVVDGLKSVARKMIAMNAVWLDETEVVRVTNKEFIQVSRDDLGGEYDIRINVSTPEADEKKASELAFMLQTTGQGSDPAEMRMIRAEIARLRKMPEFAEKIERYEPKPDPMQQQIQQLEIEKLSKEIAKLDSEANENNAGAALDNAKAENVSSDTDSKNLDFVEQEGGTKHARDVDKITAQSKAQGETKILEHNLKENSLQNTQ